MNTAEAFISSVNRTHRLVARNLRDASLKLAEAGMFSNMRLALAAKTDRERERYSKAAEAFAAQIRRRMA